MRRILDEGTARSFLGLDLQGENPRSDLRWSDQATAALARRSLPEDVAFEEPSS